MKIDILTIFPEMFTGVLQSSILKRAQESQAVSIHTINFRDYATDKHKTVDDYPYGGGGGMVLKPEPIFRAIESLNHAADTRVILMCPQGATFTQEKAVEFSKAEHLIFICGHYEGYDERIREHIVTDEISIGDYVLTGGELPAMVIIDSVVRLLPGVLGNDTSAVYDSFSTGLLEHPHYTRPCDFRDMKVPEVLTGGNHRLIDEWRRQQSLIRTLKRRPELLEKMELSPKDKEFIEKHLVSEL
ncbi:tRNA (guanosine(37)-N1)-methyltransferase TrmD [Desulfuribacillus stibiiarsenatis]|uniref:tRNA (guanine-N(1)-)-methyltransferase n=1 Tax=Desulfuribacillus stibiiarsenatis TaxID=1390249 RepID=A0A1E5L6K2_9FIRM|nr:tRNA (guanosine(37)-N1)-methyltransferase TrmD [Desulfuribacillus stibiiarsenatis]OEH85792.1 tRNA (guanosine(37)-N1)-methyltransferase TrmD [Desulfuribacillus stibiiarsenatis]